MIALVIYILSYSPTSGYAPEDSNTFYIMDWQLANYSPSWNAGFDSTFDGMRTSQGCLDYGHWYMDLETKCEAEFSSVLGLRYRNRIHDDHKEHILNNYFDVFLQLRKNFRMVFSVAPTYYKGDNEISLGFFLGKDYVNFLETFFIVENIDRSVSLKNEPSGPDKILYTRLPFKLKTHLNKYWKTGHLALKFEITNRYVLQSTELPETYPPHYQEQGLHRSFYTRFWQDINKLRLGGIFDLRQSESFQIDSVRVLEENNFEITLEPMIAYKLNEKWIPTLYLAYNFKTDDDSTRSFNNNNDSIVHYQRNIYAYLIDIEFHPGGNFTWHFGMQRQFYYNNQGIDFKERRFTLGFEYHYKNIWFRTVEAMEGDFPMNEWIHNRTYLQLMIKF